VFRYTAEDGGVTIPAGVDAAADSFPGNLAAVYTRGGRAAGTYTSGDEGKAWRKQQE
jgi:hypothetical protein